MHENEINPEKRATSEQSQAILDEIDRIVKDVDISPGLSSIKNHSAPKKIRWHNGILFIRHPEGESNVDDHNSIDLAGVAWDNPDGSRTAFHTELTVENGIQLTKHTYPPSDGHLEARLSVSKEALISGDYATVALNAAADLVSAKKDQVARVQERSLGLHFANATEAEELVVKLRQIEPAPEKA